MSQLLSRKIKVDNAPEVEPSQSSVLLEVLAAVVLLFVKVAFSVAIQFVVALNRNKVEDENVERDQDGNVHKVLQLLLSCDDCPRLVNVSTGGFIEDSIQEIGSLVSLDIHLGCSLGLESHRHGSVGVLSKELVLREEFVIGLVGQKMGLRKFLSVTSIAVPFDNDN